MGKAQRQLELRHLDVALTFVDNWTYAIDGGANIGDWSKKMSEYFENVLAFEPSARTVKFYLRRLRNIKNIEILHRALTNKVAKLNLIATVKRRTASQSFYISEEIKPGEVLINKVRGITVDSLELPDLGFIKLDLEGAEYLALQGAEQTIQKFSPVIMVEQYNKHSLRYGNTTEDVTNLLKSWGYKLVAQVNYDQIYKKG